MLYDAPVNHGNIPVADASLYHAVTLHASIERRFWVLDQVLVKVETLRHIVIGRTGESSLDGRGQLQVELLIE